METIICRECGSELPVSCFKFNKRHGKYNHVCNDCIKKKGRWTREKKKDAINQAVLRRELSEFTPIELMKELAHRGYSGKLE